MYVSTSRIQLIRPTTTEERRRVQEIYERLAKEHGFRAFYLARPSETESAAVVLFDSEADFRKALERVGGTIHAIMDPLVAGTPRGERGEVNAQYVNPDTKPGLLSIRIAHILRAVPPEQRPPIGRAFAEAAARVPSGRHAFYEVWLSDTEIVHVGVYDNRDGRARFWEQGRPGIQAAADLLRSSGTAVTGTPPPGKETVGDIWAYQVK